jgi:phosphomannomutase
VAFDGDADRAGFIDEKGAIIPMDLITGLIAQDILSQEKGVVLYDLRSSRAVKEAIEAAGGTAMMCRVGHAFIKQQMRDNNAIFAGEVSGHYYFRANYTTESSAMAVVALANIVSRTGQPLSELVRPLRRYFASGEINSRLPDRARAETVMETLRSKFGGEGRLFELDGVSVDFDDWWFNVRCSNTEPLLRLNMEASTEEQMTARRDELLAIIRG